MAQPSLAAATEACPDPDEPGVVLQLERSSTAKSRYKGVTKVNEKIWQARVMVDGKLQHLRSSRKPRDCAIALAQFKRAWAAQEKQRLETEAAVGKPRALEPTGFTCALHAASCCPRGSCPVVRMSHTIHQERGYKEAIAWRAMYGPWKTVTAQTM